jgi:hypothetical protein
MSGRTTIQFSPISLAELRRQAADETVKTGRRVTVSSIVKAVVEDYLASGRELPEPAVLGAAITRPLLEQVDDQ